jgi:hypothetical protein
MFVIWGLIYKHNYNSIHFPLCVLYRWPVGGHLKSKHAATLKYINIYSYWLCLQQFIALMNLTQQNDRNKKFQRFVRGRYLCVVQFSEKTAIISVWGIRWLVIISETVCVYCAVRTSFLNVSHINLWPQRFALWNTVKGLGPLKFVK